MKDNSGIIMLISVLVVTALISVALVTQVLVGVRSLENSNLSTSIIEVQQYTLGCMEEGLISLQRDVSYTGQVFSVGSGTCNISVSGSGSSRTMTVIGTIANSSADLSASINLSPFSLDTFSF